ncbi:RNA-binding domain-containing protein [Deinococcus aquaticus]|uniref:RNA-binding domain-containing protein n=1 Tax=Deinococcus aquaticus TaxID=328692 RepID=UPI003F445AC8
MTVDLTALARWMQDPEDERLEFKAARRQYDSDDLSRYMVALANEGGGHLVMGVTDQRPRQVCGTEAFGDYRNRQQQLTQNLRLRVTVTELAHPDGRVLVWSVPPRHLGVPLDHKGAYLMRSGESLRGMTFDELRRIADEVAPDYSAEICRGATRDDLDPLLIARFRELWAQRERRAEQDAVRGLERAQRILALSDDSTLESSSLADERGITYAALILMGTAQALTRHLSQAEVIFEFREDKGVIQAQARENYRVGFLGFLEDLWEQVNRRNDPVPLPAGMFRLPVFPFNEGVVREGILNAVAHRDYRSPESIFIRQWGRERELEIVSPGGFLPGVTPETILHESKWRNRRVAEALERCGLVERSGQGADIMFRESIKEAKPYPTFEGTTDQRVALHLYGAVGNPEFLQVMDAIAQERLEIFQVEDFMLLDEVFRRGRSTFVNERVERLVRLGVLERLGRGRLMLARRFYEASGSAGAYTRTRGLERPRQKELLAQHLRDSGANGAAASELADVLPELTRFQVLSLLKELQQDGRAHLQGLRRTARWHLGPQPD